MRWFWGVTCASALVVLAVASTPSWAQVPPPSDPPKWGPYLDFGGKAGTKRDLGEGDLFLPLWQNNVSLAFGDVRTKFDDRGSLEGNFGGGFRHMLPSGWNLGAYGYFDRRRSPYNNAFDQVTLGAEALSLDWDARANGYIPVGRQSVAMPSFNTATLSGTTILVQDGVERSLGGFDAEVGWRVPLFAADANQQLRVYAGGYRFTADDTPTVAGPRGRIDLTFNQVPHLWPGSRLSVGAEVEHDSPRGTQAFADFRIRIPFQVFTGSAAPRLSAMEQRMTDPVVRDVDVVTEAGTFGATEVATETASGSPLTVINSSATTGAALPGAVAALANGSTAVLAGTFNVSATVDLTGSKSLMAGSVTVRTPSGQTAVLNTPATISSANLLRIIQAPGNNTISGLTIVTTDNGGGTFAVSLNSTGANYHILNNTFTLTETGANAIAAISTDRNPNLVISGNSFTLTGGTTATAVGLLTVAAPVTTATVSGNTFNVSGATNNFLVNTGGAAINAGSTGNVHIAGTCTGAAASGSVSFTDGTTCH